MTELAPLQLFKQLRDEYEEITITTDEDLSKYNEIQERLREALTEAGWVWPQEECWLPMRCPNRGYCTQFLEGGQPEPCGWRQ